MLEGTIDIDGQSYSIGSIVVEGTYYQQNKITNSGIEFIKYMPGEKVYNRVTML